jgi:hypothetical protein
MKADEERIMREVPNCGGGSGGDLGEDDGGNQIKSAESTYQIGGNQVVLVSRPTQHLDPTAEGTKAPSRIVLVAGGAMPEDITDGTVDIRGAQGVRITSGPPCVPLFTPETSFDGTNGVEVAVGKDQRISLDRGDPRSPQSQSITLTPGQIFINGQTGEIVLSSLKKITLSVGQNSIVIDTSGITIIGMPAVQINPLAPPELPPLPPGEAYA